MTLVFLPLSLALTLLVTKAKIVSPRAAEEWRWEQRVWAEEGGLAVLPCHLSPQELKNSWKMLYHKTAVRWERHGGRAHKETHMVLEVECSGVLKTARSMMPRAMVQNADLRHGDFSLRIEPLQRDDVGQYEALVRYGTATLHCQVALGVVTVTVNIPGLVVETETFWLHCNSSHPGKPVGVQWFHNDSLVPTSGRFLSLSGALSIFRPTMSDMGPWRCNLAYSDGANVSATYNLQILGFSGPASSVVYAAAGSSTNLPCTLNHNPSASGIQGVKARWSNLAGGYLGDSGTSRNGDFTLHAPEVGPGDAGQYRCDVSIRGTTITKEVTLAIIMVTPSIKGPVAEGSHLMLICSLTHPQGHEHFQWRHIDSAYSNRNSVEATSRDLGTQSFLLGSTLELPRVSQKDTGTWECSIHGPEGRLGAVEYGLEITDVQVSGPPPILGGQVTFGLLLFIFLLLMACALVLALWNRRVRSPHFPALEKEIPAPRPGNGGKDGGQEGKIQQTEC
ncbi:lymphocyte activation 3 protein [Alligator mississippiensis]|uniref:Lymphocyte activation gene 3 protein n=1 Tax=Alligator mississippiensis TaxID=8496 RepID=A0A151MCP1_ALLMI|nr:lymphocyte activation 3 protein [Alligator mississippiensis]